MEEVGRIADGQNQKQICGDLRECVGVWGAAVVIRNSKNKVAGGRGQIRKVRSPSTEEVRFGRSGSSEMNMVLPSPSFPSYIL